MVSLSSYIIQEDDDTADRVTIIDKYVEYK